MLVVEVASSFGRVDCVVMAADDTHTSHRGATPVSSHGVHRWMAPLLSFIAWLTCWALVATVLLHLFAVPRGKKKKSWSSEFRSLAEAFPFFLPFELIFEFLFF